MENDPVFRKGQYWYFWDESWSQAYGPWLDEAKARKALAEHVAYLNDHKEAKCLE